ncbi:MAG: sulfatase-like hydrolase/transferase [Pseudobdellovibrionaceae bacterium]
MLKKLDLTTRALLLALMYSLLWLIVHWSFVQPELPWVWVFPQLFSSLLIFLCLNGLFISFGFYRWGRFVQPLITLAYIQPIFQISYFKAYKSFLEQQNISLLLREPMFVFNVFAKEVSLLQGLLLFGLWIGFHFLNHFFLQNRGPQNQKPKPYFLFSSKISWLFLILAIGSQVKWCLKHDTSQLIMRPLYPVVLFALLSIFLFFYRSQFAIWKKAFFVLALFLNVSQLYALNLGFPEFRDKMTLDSRFYRAFFGAYFVNTALGTLDQSDQALQKFEELPLAKMDYNILVILDDSQRWDHSNRHGFSEPTDDSLNWFYDQALDFQFPISPANFTDTSVPAFLTGLGSNRDVLQIKGSLTLWDYYAKGAETFFLSSQPLDWSHLDLFYKSVGQKNLWSAIGSGAFKGNQELVDDSFLVAEFKKFLSLNQGPWVGVLQTFSSHYPYNKYPGAPQPYQPCDLTRESGVENFKNCYKNGQVSAAFAKNDILKAVDLSKTIVILTSDHGEGFNEHGIWFHGVDYHQEMVKVPFFLYLPPAIKAKIPKPLLANLEANSKRVISTMDLLPTLLEIHEILSGQKLANAKTKFSGRSLLQTWNERLVFSSHCFPQYRCYSREIAFVNDDYFVLFRPSEGFYKIYPTFHDLSQTHPLDPKEIPRHKLKQIVEEAADQHSIGQSMKAYFESL